MRKVIAALAIGLFAGSAAMKIQAAIPAGPVEPTATGIIGQVNAYLGNILSLSANTGELQFFSTQSWSDVGAVATTMTSLGPTGSHTTVQKWLVVLDNTGTRRFVPAY